MEAVMQIGVAISVYLFILALAGNFRELIVGIHICNLLAIFRAMRLIVIIQELQSFRTIFAVLGGF